MIIQTKPVAFTHFFIYNGSISDNSYNKPVAFTHVYIYIYKSSISDNVCNKPVAFAKHLYTHKKALIVFKGITRNKIVNLYK